MNAEFKVVICGGCDRPTTAAVNGLCPQCFTRFNGKQRPMTDAEREQQRRSFAYGNVSLHNPDVTRELVDRVADEMTQESEPPMTQPPREVERTPREIALANWLEFHAEYTFGEPFKAHTNEAAELLRTAVNSRAALVAACEVALGLITNYGDGEITRNHYCKDRIEQIRTVLLAEKDG